MFRENLIKVIIHLIKHTPFINSGESGKDTNATIIFDIKFARLMRGYNVSFFQFCGTIELNTELLKLQSKKIYLCVILLFSQGCNFLDMFFFLI